MIHFIKCQDGTEYGVCYTQAVAVKLAIAEKIPTNMITKLFGDIGSWDFGRLHRWHYLAFKTAAATLGRDFPYTEDTFIDWLYGDETIMPQLLSIQSAAQPESEKKQKAVKAEK